MTAALVLPLAAKIPPAPMIRFFFHPTPNPAKVALFLGDAELPYEVVPVDTSTDEQHAPDFRMAVPLKRSVAKLATDDVPPSG